ncbi:MAG TPA: hypothetical protein VG843_09240 [Rhizomicrobium sp.]|jgi:hypothetical protein|nr:hypothetical protein [Rhizomicrobium sp.]
MSGLVFLSEVVAFVLIAYWAYRSEARGLLDASWGLFAMKDSAADDQRRGPRYKAALQPRIAEKAALPSPAGKSVPAPNSGGAPAQPWRSQARLNWRRGR